jgi:hypothetical protein
MSERNVGLPNFLIIGSAKSGTTTLFSDLGANEQIFFPVVKEPSDLIRDDVLHKDGLAAYRRIFSSARPDQILGEASTPYTSRPIYEGVAERAQRVLGPDLKLIYIVRDPLERILSEHRYAAQQEKVPADINVALRETPRIVERSRYAYQLEPWLAQFPRESLRVLVFEQYIVQREPIVRELFDFLGATTPPDYVVPEPKNYTSDVIVARGFLRNVVRSETYRRTVRRLIPQALRERAKTVLGRKSEIEVEQQLAPDNERALLDKLRPEVEALHRIAGWDKPVWPRFA